MEIRLEASQIYNLPTILVQLIAGQIVENAMDQNCPSAELNVNSCNFRAMSPLQSLLKKLFPNFESDKESLTLTVDTFNSTLVKKKMYKTPNTSFSQALLWRIYYPCKWFFSEINEIVLSTAQNNRKHLRLNSPLNQSFT